MAERELRESRGGCSDILLTSPLDLIVAQPLAIVFVSAFLRNSNCTLML